MSIAIFGLTLPPTFVPDLKHLFTLLKKYNRKIYVFKPFWDNIQTLCAEDHLEVDGFFVSGAELPAGVEFLISIGGDGTFLKSMLSLKNKSIPVVGINSGHLGFLADIARDEIEENLELIFAGNYRIIERSVLELCDSVDLFGDFNYALNEITVTKLDTSSMIKIHTYLNGEYLTSYVADGLLISTPTGSTAYSLSVGGPILTPDSNSWIITPIASHNLTVRPIVVPDNSKITLRIEGRGQQFLASLDSRSEAVECPGEIVVRKADFSVKTLRLEGRSFFNTLRNKLMWGADKRN